MFNARKRCLENDDLTQLIFTYMDLIDLLALERCDHTFQRIANYLYRRWEVNPLYAFLWYKRQDQYLTKKERMSYLVHCKKTCSAGFIVCGSGLDSLGGQAIWIKDNPLRFNGYLLPSLTSAQDGDYLGFSSACLDCFNELYLIGGCFQSNEEAESMVYSTKREIESIEDLPSHKLYKLNHLDRPRASMAVSLTVDGHMVICGGSASCFTPTEAYSSCLLKRPDSKDWRVNIISSMNSARAGHGLVTLLNNQLIAMGGYISERNYSATVELYDFEKNQWYDLPPMINERDGFVSTLGPYGSVYICGGSPEGLNGLRDCERFDPREGKWESIASMYLARGYTAGAVGASTVLYVCGGINDFSVLQSGVECYDFKMNRWYGLAGSINDSEINSIMVDVIPSFASWSSDITDNHSTEEYCQLRSELLRSSHQMVFVE